ncbi:hypothetical protein M5D96_009429 [Drosophila gunungcola]|uniref:Uncharacterized protein n=1 Tax=Drosophila gunungcola TaxID=103775 RepID=A0A9P9YJT9_9MUSC|nr:hypothetical protein M5D96_009429 [Drosophila gunungcola]
MWMWMWMGTVLDVAAGQNGAWGGSWCVAWHGAIVKFNQDPPPLVQNPQQLLIVCKLINITAGRPKIYAIERWQVQYGQETRERPPKNSCRLSAGPKVGSLHLLPGPSAAALAGRRFPWYQDSGLRTQDPVPRTSCPDTPRGRSSARQLEAVINNQLDDEHNKNENRNPPHLRLSWHLARAMLYLAKTPKTSKTSKARADHQTVRQLSPRTKPRRWQGEPSSRILTMPKKVRISIYVHCTQSQQRFQQQAKWVDRGGRIWGDRLVRSLYVG